MPKQDHPVTIDYVVVVVIVALIFLWFVKHPPDYIVEAVY